MKTKSHTQRLRRRLALLLLLSTINFIAAPFLLAGKSAAAPPNAPDGPTNFVRRINLTTNDLVYSASAGRIYASVPSSAGSSGNSLKAIDPTTGLVTSTTFVGSEPNKLAISDDGHSLYVSLDGSLSICRFDTLTNTTALKFQVGVDSIFGRYSVGDLAVAPANPSVLAVARVKVNTSPPGGGVAIFDDGVRRPNAGPGHIFGSDSIAFSASASKLYGAGETGFQTMAIDASGVTVSSTTSLASGALIKFSGGKIFSSAGQVIDPDSSTLLGSFFGATSQAFVPDTAAGRAYYVTSGPGVSFTLRAFDINTFVQIGSLVIDGVSGTPTSLLRWGPNGLAFRTTNNQLFIIQTSLIPSAEPIPTPTPIPSPTPTPSPSPSAATFVRTIALPTNDLVYNQTTQKLYASVPSSAGSSGNSLAEIDPVAGSSTSQVFVGSEPTHLAPADDNQTLYVGLDGAASLRSYNILSHTAGIQFPVGSDGSSGPYSFSDIAVSPGNPLVVAAARQRRGLIPPEAGVAVFDNGVQRTQTGARSDFLAFATPTTLYGYSLDGLTRMTIDNGNVTVDGTTHFNPGNSMIFANGLLYGASGQILNPSTDQIVGTFTNVGSPSAHVIDVVNNRAFFATIQGSGVQITAYNLNTFLPVGFANVSGFSEAASLIRWGTNGLAFRTNGQVVLVETALVNDSVPVPSPTPTPSPTPSPSPPYIPTFIRRVHLPANNLVYSEATQALYASVSGSAGANGNSITKITPDSGAVGPSTFVGSEPNKMAISDDGQTIWVHLDGAMAARRFEVVNQTPGLQFNTGTQSPTDMEVVPGSPQSLAMTRGILTGVSVYDNGVQRPNIGNFITFVGPIEFAGPSVLYGYDSFSTGFGLTKYLIDSSGATQTTTLPSLLVGFTEGMEFSNGLLYSGFGRVADPEAGTLIGIFQQVGSATGIAVDAANHRVFYVTSINGNIVLQAFDSNTFLPVGSITIPGNFGSPFSLVRWGVNGLAFTTQNQSGTDPSQVFLLQSELVSNAAPIPIGLQFETDTIFTIEDDSTLSIKVTRTGDISGTTSVNYGTSNGTATAGTDYTATSGTLTFAPGELSKNVSVPIINDNLFENGNETFSLTLSGPTGAGILITPSTSIITIGDNDPKPTISSLPTIQITEGDSGSQNIAVNVTLSNPTVQVVTVDYTTANGSATAGSDYVAASGTLTIPAGSTSIPINIQVNGDLNVEPNETFTVTLSNATNVNFISNSVANVTIANDDATVQFNNVAVSVNEGAGFVNVTVTRVGDTSRPALVLSSTADTAGLQSCTIANGKASERCDYATVGARLQFGIGETTKTFTIPIVDDALVEGDETLTVNLSGPVGTLIGATSTATLTIIDNDTTPATQNPIDGVTPFITQQYIDFLGRLPDPIGLANWTTTLAPCPNGGFGEFDHPECDRVHVSAGFFLSDEFRGRGYFAYKFYEVGFDRRPAYAEFVPDMAVVGGAQSPQSEVISKQIYMIAFVQRPEFKNRYDVLSNSAYVDALEANAEVVLTNKAALVAALDGNQKTRAQVLSEIVELQSVTDKFFIRAFVAMQYFGYLRRDPDTIGYDNWVTTLTADPSNFRHMIFGFIYSDEYRHRFGP